MYKLVIGICILLLILVGARYLLKALYKTASPPIKPYTNNFPPSPIPSSPSENTPTETSNWKEYRNEKNGYSIQYPPEISYVAYSNGDTRFYLTADGKENNTPTGFKDSLEILTRSGNSPQETAKEELAQSNFENISFNNVSGVKMQADNNFPFDYYVSPSGKNLPILRIYSSIDYSTEKATQNEKTQQIFSTMIHTFKFTK